MADRYHERTYAAADAIDRDRHLTAKAENDPLAELARLIGQSDPNADFGLDRAAEPRRSHGRQPLRATRTEQDSDVHPAGPPPWMRNRETAQAPMAEEPSVPRDVHPLRRYAAAHHLPDPTYQAPRVQPEPDPAGRYDEALYGPADAAMDAAAYGHAQHPGYQDDYSYQDDYADEDEPAPRRKGVSMVVAIIALAVVGTGAAFAYRTFVRTPRSGEPPIIKADAGPNKVVPPSAENSSKQIQDRMAAGNAAEQLVPREEQPVDVKDIAQSGPRVVFPPLNQNANPPSTASVAPGNKLAANGGSAAAVGGTEPRKIKTLMVRSDDANAAAAEPVTARAPAPVPAPPATTRAAAAPVNAAPAANAPLSLAPQAAPSRVASVNPAQAEPATTTGGYVVQVSSQRSEADARASFKVLQHKFPSALGSRSPLIKRADLGSKGVYYRAMVGPFGSSEQAVQFCGSLRSAGGQCVVQRN